MTAAFNLASLASNLNSTGQIDATDGLTGLLANANLASTGTADSSSFLSGARSWANVSLTGRIVQAVSITNSTIYSTSSASFVEINSTMRLNITPQSSSNKMLIMYSMPFGGGSGASDNNNRFAIYRGTSTNLVEGNSYQVDAYNSSKVCTRIVYYIDSPNTTSAIYYTIYWKVYTASVVNYLNSRDGTNSNPLVTGVCLEISQ